MIPPLAAAFDDTRVTPQDFRVLFYLVMYELDPVLFRELKVVVVARSLRDDEDGVSRSLLRLTRLGYLECQPRPHPGALAKYRYVHRVEHTDNQRVPKAS